MRPRKLLSLLFLLTSFSALKAQRTIFDIARHGTTNELDSLMQEDPKAIDLRNEAGYTPLILACYHGNEEVVYALIEQVKDIDGSSEMGTPLMAATVKGYASIVKALLEKGANPNISDANGTTALHYATMFQLEDIVKMLVDANADTTSKDNRGNSPLDYATLKNDKTIISILKTQ